MTNKEYLFKYLSEHEERLIGMLSVYSCSFCDEIGLRTYCHNVNDSCFNTIKSWLSMEHEEPLLFSIGTPVEIDDNDSRRMGYYNGFENDNHYVVIYKQHIGYRYKDGELYGIRCKANQLKKVGDSNA